MKKHNWFIIDGEIRTEKEFDQLLEKIGDVYGITKHSPTVDKESLQQVIKTIAMTKVNKVKL